MDLLDGSTMSSVSNKVKARHPGGALVRSQPFTERWLMAPDTAAKHAIRYNGGGLLRATPLLTSLFKQMVYHRS